MTDQGFKMTVVVEALDPPELFEWFADLRKDLGMTVVPTRPEGGAGGAARRCEPTRPSACCATATSIGPASRSSSSVSAPRCPPGRRRWRIRTGAPLLPVGVLLHRRSTTATTPSFVRRADRATRAGLRDDVSRVTQALPRELEFLIRRAPEQWHLFQPNWPSDPGYGD